MKLGKRGEFVGTPKWKESKESSAARSKKHHLETYVRKTVKVENIELKIVEYMAAKAAHKSSTQCERTIGGCTACHFWSGAISALSDLVGR